MVGPAIRPLQWSENFAVGHAGLDAQHRLLVELINDIDAAAHSKKNPEGLLELLKLLRGTAEEHVRQEDALLWEIKSGTYAPLSVRPPTPRFLEEMAEMAFNAHMADHATLLARLDACAGMPVDALGDSLKVWFLDHAIRHDSQLKAIFQALQ